MASGRNQLIPDNILRIAGLQASCFVNRLLEPVDKSVRQAWRLARGCESSTGRGETEPLAEGKGVAARRGLKEATGKARTRRTETGYKAGRAGKAAMDAYAQYFTGTPYGKPGAPRAKALYLTLGGPFPTPVTGQSSGDAG